MSRKTVVLKNAMDTFVNANLPGRNYATSTRLSVGNTVEERMAYIWFNKPPRGVTVLSATLRLVEVGGVGGSRTMTLKRITESWKGGRTTYNNRPTTTIGGQVQVTKSTSASNVVWEFDVTANMQNAADLPGRWFGWNLSSDEAVIRRFYSAQAAQFKPQLTYTYTTRPDRPSDLIPDGGQAVAVAKPTFTFDFTDTSGSTEMAGYRVQFDANENFTTPDYDTGWVASDTPEYDAAADAGFVAMTASEVRYWRVAVEDEAGERSLFSDPAEFTYKTKATLTLDNPGSGGVIEERTPPVFWSFTGTQNAFQVIVRDSGGNELHDTGRLQSADNEYTIPLRNEDGDFIIANVDEETYELILRVWDNVHRGGPRTGAPAYQQVSRTLVYNRDATVDPVTNVVVSELVNLPGIRVEWQTAIAPDRFYVDRKVGDGPWKWIREIEPDDAFVSGTTYALRDRRCPPRRSVRYRVAAVRDTGGGTHKTSTETLSSTITSSPIGVWLIDEDRDIYVQLVGDVSVEMAYGEEATTHFPIGSRRGVRVTQSLRGQEGTVSGGMLVDRPWRTAQQFEGDLLNLKRFPGQEYLLLLSDQTIPVVIGNVSIQETPHADSVVKVAGFEFWQSRGLPFVARV